MSNLNNRSCHFASILDVWQWSKEKKVVIPDIQRGLVWNAAQIEVFWDSLLRNIPVGIFTAAEIGGEGKRPASSMVMVDRGEIFSKGKMATK